MLYNITRGINMEKFIENETIELKRELNDTFIKEVVGFLNTRDGTVYIGIDDKGKILGVLDINKTMLKIRDIVREQISPSTENLIEIGSKLFDDNFIIEVKVKKGLKLFHIKKYGLSPIGCYFRDGSATSQMSPKEIERRYQRSLYPHHELLSEKASTYDRLTFEILKIKLTEHKIHINEETFYKNFNLKLDNGKYTKLAEMLADENMFELSVCIFQGKDKADYLMRTSFKNKCALEVFRDVLNYCKSLNGTYVDLSVRPRREKKMFDNDAFTEAWTNAFVHNDWSTLFPPQIYWFEDRMEIESHGGIPLNMSDEDFLKGISKPVNPDLMKIMKNCEMVEHSGHGVPQIVRVYGKRAFSFEPTRIVVTIPFDKEGFKNKNNETFLDKDYFKQKYEDLLNNIEMHIVDLILQDKQITREKMAKELGLSTRTVQKYVNSLKEKNIIVRKGSDKQGWWELTN